MLTRNRITAGSIVVAAACVLTGLSGAGDNVPPEDDPDQLSGVMKDKLRFTHQLLTSLAREDFAMLENSAQDLRRIAHEQWMANPSPEYRSHLQAFWTTLDGIETGAQRKEIEEATLAYMQMTLSCVRCHKAIRRVQERQ